MHSWLPNFIKKSNSIKTLLEFSITLRNSLNAKMHPAHLKQWASGFHLTGFDKDNNPEFIHFSNTEWSPVEQKYTIKLNKYKEPYGDFQERDYKEFFSGTGIDWSELKGYGYRSYRNGDFAIHNAAWDKLDQAFNEIFSKNNFSFKKTKNDESIIKYYKFKLKFIGDIYQQWGHTKNVGGPFDIVILKPRK